MVRITDGVPTKNSLVHQIVTLVTVLYITLCLVYSCPIHLATNCPPECIISVGGPKLWVETVNTRHPEVVRRVRETLS